MHVVDGPLLAHVPPLAETVPFPCTVSLSSAVPPTGGVVEPDANVAVTDLAAVIVTVHEVLVPPHAPPHPLKSESPPGAATRVTVVPLASLTLQVVFPDPQLMPPPVTRPSPVTETVSGNVVPPPPPAPPEPEPVKAADTEVSPVTVNVQVVVDPEHAPPHEVNPAPAPAVAVRVTLELAATVAVQVEPPADVQLIPPLAPVTVPLPVTATVTVCEDAPARNAALTV